MQKFCHHCGTKVVVGANFCPSCGTNLSSLSSIPTPPPATPAKSQATFQPFAAENEDDDPIDHIQKLDIRINRLEVDIVGGSPMQGESMASVMSQGSNGPAQPITTKAAPVDSKEFMESFRREAGAQKPNERTRSVEITA